ncbi:MAG TPA: plasmid pRiA4b ORF-3 family protein [Candidatus Bathyarchaeia archaeon]|nr:plasmid pRiA4b ORF-3 family protein [Candidatus Bathyarchaeia archaeon]
MGLKTRIKKASDDQQFVEFTQKELEKLGDEIDASLVYVPPAHRKQLNVVLNKIGDLLAYLVVKHLVYKGQAVDKAGAIYQFKVTLNESHPPIWRRIQVPDCTLGELHEILQIVMGWEDCHLHQFIVRGEYYGPLDPEDLHWDMEKEDEEKISISQVAKTGRKVRFIYEYDFGDSWQHEILLEKIMEPEPNESYPRCIEGERASPPEDVGGIWGYSEFLEAISDPKHEQRDDLVDWIGGKFDPEKFSVEKVNRELREHH